MARDKFRSIAPYPQASVQVQKCVCGLGVLKNSLAEAFLVCSGRNF